ncbi:hypothetical protein PINS_up014586 [Pythium insidiosum]|nr:hypothetical protein PINS_up014586 [Pythium insidiosum]
MSQPPAASNSNVSTLIATTAAFAAGVASGVALYAARERRERQRVVSSTAPLDPTKAETMREPAAELVDLIVRYHDKLHSRDPKTSYAVRPNVKPGSIVAQIPRTCPDDPESYASIFKDCEDIILPGLTHWVSPNFFAYFKTFGSEPSALAELLAASLNIVGFSWVAAPAATELEIAMCDWVARLLGLPECFLSTTDGGGVIQGSASDSLLCAMIAARNRALEGLEGQARVDKASRLVMYVSDQTHSIGGKGCLVLDLPHLRVIPTRRGATDPDNYGLHPDDVAAAMQEDVAAGLVPFMLVPTVGTTSTTAIDPVRALVAVARQQREPVWVHIDGAYGGAAAVCPEYQHWMDGAEHVDSVCVNAHKWLLVPMDCSLLWVRDRRPLVKALTLDPEYLKNEFMSQVNYKDWQVALGRRFRSLKLLVHAASAWGERASCAHPTGPSRWPSALRRCLAARTALHDLYGPCACHWCASMCRSEDESLNEAVIGPCQRRRPDLPSLHSVVDGTTYRLAVGGSEISEWNIDNAVEVLSQSLTEPRRDREQVQLGVRRVHAPPRNSCREKKREIVLYLVSTRSIVSVCYASSLVEH